jgi:diacylglycerol kinase
MQHFIASRLRSFGYAFRGWWYVLRSQRNAWLHVIISIVVIGVGAWLGLRPLEWAVIVLTMAIVFAAEFLNTAIEAVVDLASPHKHPLAKVGKDVGAGAVLIAALAAVVIGVLILGPPLWTRLRSLFGLP